MAQTAKEKETQIIKRRDKIGGRTINLLLAITGERVPFSHQERRNKTSVVSSRSGNRCSSPNRTRCFSLTISRIKRSVSSSISLKSDIFTQIMFKLVIRVSDVYQLKHVNIGIRFVNQPHVLSQLAYNLFDHVGHTYFDPVTKNILQCIMLRVISILSKFLHYSPNNACNRIV